MRRTMIGLALMALTAGVMVAAGGTWRNGGSAGGGGDWVVRLARSSGVGVDGGGGVGGGSGAGRDAGRP